MGGNGKHTSNTGVGEATTMAAKRAERIRTERMFCWLIPRRLSPDLGLDLDLEGELV